jgi:hypothetical protein
MSHFPLYCSNCPKPGHDHAGGAGLDAAAVSNQSSAWYQSEKCEFEGHNPSCTDPGWDADQTKLKEAQRHIDALGFKSGPASNADMVPDFEPLFMKYGVDVYSSGHIHDYEFIYPTHVVVAFC